MKSFVKDRSANRLIVQCCFNDIDEAAEAINVTSGRKVQLTQMSLQQFQGNVLLADLGQVAFSFSTSNCSVRCLGEKSIGYINFSCILNPHNKFITAHGVQVSEDSLCGFDPNREVDMVIPPNLEACHVQIKQSVLDECLQIMERSDIDEKFLAANVIYSPITLLTIRTYLTQLRYLVEQQPHLLKQPHLEKLILEDFVPLLIDAIPQTRKTIQPLSFVNRSKLVKQAEDYMMANLDQPLTLKALCKALHVSRSPLFYGFEEMFGIGPMTYLKIHRLHGVRRSLKVAAPKTSSVMSIAQKFGFWSAGHFARDYKQMFGELPSETFKH